MVAAAFYHSINGVHADPFKAAAKVAAAVASNNSYPAYSSSHLHHSMFSMPPVPSLASYQANHLTSSMHLNGTANNTSLASNEYSLGVNYKDSKFFNSDFLSDYEKKYEISMFENEKFFHEELCC